MALVLSTTLEPPAVPTSSSHRGGGGFRRRADGRARRAAAVSAVSSGRGGLWGASSHHILGGDERFGGGGGGDKRTIASIASGCGSGWRQRPVGLGRRAPMVMVVKASNEDDVEAVTKKWGLEAGLWKVFRSKPDESQGSASKMDSAKKLLKTYGSAYLITSISLSLVSITVFYILISSGVGLSVTSNSERVGTFALAYAAHKAASPIRFPPTVALTPVVAGWMGKEIRAPSSGDDGDDGGAEEAAASSEEK